MSTEASETSPEGIDLGRPGFRHQAQSPQEWTGACAAQLATASCRVCLEEDGINNLCQPCVCTGSMSHAHPGCIQHWINEKGDMLCEICKQPYKGSFKEPSPLPRQATAQAPAARLSSYRGFLVSADAESAAFTRSHFHEESTEFEQERASATWCLAAVLIFMLLLLMRHVFDVFAGPTYPDGKPSELMVDSPEFTDGGVTIAWGALNESEWNPSSGSWEAGVAAAPGKLGVDASAKPESVSPWILLLWLLLRFSAVAVPALLAYCLMASFREAQDLDEFDYELENSSELARMEAGMAAARPEVSSLDQRARSTPVGGTNSAPESSVSICPPGDSGEGRLTAASISGS